MFTVAHGADCNWHKAACAFCSLSAMVKVSKASACGRTYAFHYHSDHAARSDATIGDHRAERKLFGWAASRRDHSSMHRHIFICKKLESPRLGHVNLRARCEQFVLWLWELEILAIISTAGDKKSSKAGNKKLVQFIFRAKLRNNL